MKGKIPALFYGLLLSNCFVVGFAQSNQFTASQDLNGYVRGAPTNDISAAIRFSAVPQPNAAVCLLYQGKSNSSQLWIAPPQFQRVKYRLDDSSGKAVPYLPAYHPPHKIYRSSHEVPKNVHNVYEGLMGVPFPMPYDQVSLTNIFLIRHNGNYTLTAKAQILRINGDSSLSLVEFPPVSLTIHISLGYGGSRQ